MANRSSGYGSSNASDTLPTNQLTDSTNTTAKNESLSLFSSNQPTSEENDLSNQVGELLNIIFDSVEFIQKGIDFNKIFWELPLKQQEELLYITLFILEQRRLKDDAKVGFLSEREHELLNQAELAMDVYYQQFLNITVTKRIAAQPINTGINIEELTNQFIGFFRKNTDLNEAVLKLPSKQQKELQELAIALLILHKKNLEFNAQKRQLTSTDLEIFNRASVVLLKHSNRLKEIRQINLEW